MQTRNMNKEFIPYEQALALKELGFDENCIAFYEPGNKQVQVVGVEQRYNNPELLRMKDFCAPLYQQAFRWFREKYKLQAEILWRGDMNCFCYKTGKFKQGSHDFSKDDYNTYEEAELECLKQLIEIVKNG
jgi:hypothetical protein